MEGERVGLLIFLRHEAKDGDEDGDGGDDREFVLQTYREVSG